MHEFPVDLSSWNDTGEMANATSPQQRHVKSKSNCEAKWFGKWTADRPKLP